MATTHWSVQLVAWSVFLCLFLMSWDLALPGVIDKLNDETDLAEAALRPFRRTYLIALALYALLSVWFNLLFLMILGYIGCALVALTAHYNPFATMRRITVTLFDPNMLFCSVASQHAAMHGAVLAGSVLMAVMPACLWYVSTADLRVKHAVRAKFHRLLFALPATLTTVYTAYAIAMIVAAAMAARAAAK